MKHKREVRMKTHEVNIMKTFKSISSKGLFGRIAAAVLLMLSFGVAPPLVHAATSGNATIFNEATVSYTSGTTTLTASADVSVTVITLAANPTVTVDLTAQSVAAAANAVYNYTLRSNANGVDTYNLTLASVDADVTASTDVIAASSTLWGGIVLGSPVAGEITLPGGSVTTLVAGTSTVELTVAGGTERYTVTTITAGNAESSGVPEVLDVLALTPVGASPAIGIGDVVAGTQVGQYAVTVLTQTAGTPTTPGTDGTHTNNLTTTSTATLADNATTATYTTSAGDGNETITTVVSPSVTILKESRNFTTTSAWVSDGSTTAKPGEVIEYRLTITNIHATASTTNVFLTDVIPAYTTINTAVYGADDVQIDYTDVAGGGANDYSVTDTIANDGDQAEEIPAGTLQVTVGDTAGDAGVPTGGTLDAGDIAVVLFQVTVL